MGKKEVIVTALEIVRARLPEVHHMNIGIWRFFINMDIPNDPDEMFVDFDGNYHFIKYLPSDTHAEKDG